MDLRSRLEFLLRAGPPGAAPGEVHRRARAVMLADPRGVAQPDFRLERPAPLEFLAQVYDGLCFEGALTAALAGFLDAPVEFRVSPRLTSRPLALEKVGVRSLRQARVTYSSAYLAPGVYPEPEGTWLCGHLCRDRLAMVQRLTEQVLLWLAVWCCPEVEAGLERLGSVLFGHVAGAAPLPPLAVRLEAVHGIAPGDRVAFEVEGVPYQGVVERVGRRATVRVADPDPDLDPDPGAWAGADGRPASRAHVPLGLLRRLASGPAGEAPDPPPQAGESW